MSLAYCKKLLSSLSECEVENLIYLDLSNTRFTLLDIELICQYLKKLKTINLCSARHITDKELKELQEKYKTIKFIY